MADRAVILARASSSKQAIEGDTLDEQMLQCSDFIIKQSWTEDRTFPFVESGRKKEREYFEEVIKYCEDPHNQIKYVVFKNISRFTRGGDEAYLHLKKRLNDAGVEIRDIYGTIRESVNTMESYGKKYDWSTYSPSQSDETYQANRAKDFVRDALTQMIGAEITYTRKGYWNRRPAYGFINQKIETTEDGLRNILVPHPKESEYVMTIFDLRANSAMSDIEIVQYLNTMGYCSRTFKRRDPRTKKVIGKGGGVPLTVKWMQQIIARPVYAGIICESWTQQKPVRAKFDGLVDIGTFNRANRGKVVISGNINEPQIKYGSRLIDTRIVKRRSRDNPMYPFKNFILCPICSNKIHASASTGKRGVKFPAYHHSKNHKYWSVSKKVAEDNIYAFIRRIKFNEDFIKLFEATFLEVWKEQRVSLIKESRLAGEHVNNLLAKQASALDSIKTTTSEMVRKALELDFELLDTQIKEARSARVSKEQNELNVKLSIKYAVYLMEHTEELLIDTDNPMQQGPLFALAFDELPRYDELINGTPKLSPIFSLNAKQNLSKSELVTPIGFEPMLPG